MTAPVRTPAEADPRPVWMADDHHPGRFGWVFAAIWLFFLVDPVRQAAHEPSLPLRVLGLAALLAFAVGFTSFFGWWRRRRMTGRTPRPAAVHRVLAAGLVLLALAAPAAGVDVLAGLVYVGVCAAMTLSLRHAVAVVVSCAALVFVLPRLVPGWTPQDGAVPTLLLGCFAAFGIGQVIERNAELTRARAQLVDLAVARERERVARDVHDVLGHSLTVVTVKTELAGRLLDALPPDPRLERARAEVADAERLAREALADVRATVSGMRSVSLAGELATARQALEAAGIAGDLPTAVDDVPARRRDLFAWALREGVTNVVRHSGATRCWVRLTADCVEVRDDGHGPGDAVSGGTGLAGLRSRAETAGCRLETGRAPEGGFLLRVGVGRGRGA